MELSRITTKQETRLINLLSTTKYLSEQDAEKLLALATHLGLTVKESFEIENTNDCNFEYGSNEYLVCTDSEADERWDESLDNYIEELILPEIPKYYQRYFNEEAWKSDARHDGRGHCLSSYDGDENEERINGTTYYIYRIN